MFDDYKKYYSPSNKGFYVENVNTYIPEDAFEITQEHYTELFLKQGEGLQIHYDENTKVLDAVDPKSLWTEDDWWDHIRGTRKWLLRESDTAVLPDRWAAMSPEKQQEWSVYRQALRDIPQTATDVKNIVWPTIPE